MLRRCRFQPYDWLHHHPVRAVDSVYLRILLMGTCGQCGSWSVAGHNHGKVTGRRPQFFNLAWRGPWRVRKWFIRDHIWWGRLKHGCRTGGSVTIVWLTTEAYKQTDDMVQIKVLHTMPAPHHSVFYRPDALPAAQPTASKHWRSNYGDSNKTN